MIEKLQHRFALSERGAKDLAKGVIACAVQNVSFMVPVSLLYFFVGDLLKGEITHERTVFYIVGSLLALALMFGITYWQYNATFLATYVETGTRRLTLAEKLRKLPLSYFGKKDLADLTSTIMADCTFLETAFSHFIPPFAGTILSTVLISVSLFFFDWRMALASLWVLPVSFGIVFSSTKLADRMQQKAMKAKMACADGIQECIETMQDLKSNNAEAAYMKGLDEKVDNVEKEVTNCELLTAVYMTCAQLILKLGIGTTAVVGASLLIQGSLDALTFFMFLLVVSRLYDPMQSVLQNLAAIISTRTNVKRMNEILDHPVQTGANTLSNQGCDICFDHVGFSYQDGEVVLKDVSFTAKQGQVTALVGPSGGGKTTISRLAARFYDCSRGKITVGGMDVSKVEPETLMSLYSIVFQDVTLFNNSILENIRLGRRGATDEEVLAAAKMANCDEFALKLPDGYHSMIGENGCELSGGERQRISIARAFLKDAPVILLDEATASLDVENESAIQTALSRLIKDKTVMVIAHRMRTIAGADKIVVLKDGVVAEEGTAEELSAANGIYSHMAALQMESQNWTIA